MICRICTQPTDVANEAIWISPVDGSESHLHCVDNLAATVLQQAQSGNMYARSVVEAFFKRAREMMSV